MSEFHGEAAVPKPPKKIQKGKKKLKEKSFTLCPAAINCCATDWPAF
jgi:hypothetical protein